MNKIQAYDRGIDHTHAHALALSTFCDCLTNLAPANVRWIDEYEQEDFARAGTTARDTVDLAEGALPMFQHTMEPMLRTKLGMPVKLVKGVVTLIEPFTLCTEGDELTAEQAQILALLKHKMETFKPALHCKWWGEQFKMY